jgi:hypothetical protein
LLGWVIGGLLVIAGGCQVFYPDVVLPEQQDAATGGDGAQPEDSSTDADATTGEDAPREGDSSTGADVTPPEADGATDADGASTGDSGFDCATLNATICDDFARTVLIPTGDKRWTAAPCDTGMGASIAANFGLDVHYPAAPSDMSMSACYLQSLQTNQLANPLATVSSYTIDFDVVVQTAAVSGVGVIIAEASMVPPPPDSATDVQIVQLVVDGLGQAQVNVLYAREGYQTHTALSMTSPNVWLTSGTNCHVTMTVDTTVPTLTASAACGGGSPVSLPLVNNPTAPPAPGFVGPATVQVGYQSQSPPQQWSLVYGNYVFHASP